MEGGKRDSRGRSAHQQAATTIAASAPRGKKKVQWKAERQGGNYSGRRKNEPTVESVGRNEVTLKKGAELLL